MVMLQYQMVKAKQTARYSQEVIKVRVRLNRAFILRRMAEAKLTGRALAERMGCSKQAISALLARGTCSHINAMKLAEALGADYNDILEEGSKHDDVS